MPLREDCIRTCDTEDDRGEEELDHRVRAPSGSAMQSSAQERAHRGRRGTHRQDSSGWNERCRLKVDYNIALRVFSVDAPPMLTAERVLSDSDRGVRVMAWR